MLDRESQDGRLVLWLETVRQKDVLSCWLWRGNMSEQWLKYTGKWESVVIRAAAQSLLTDANRGLSRPLVVLQANPHRGAYKPEPRVALVDHCVPVAEAIAADMAVHNGVWRATMARWGQTENRRKLIRECVSTNPWYSQFTYLRCQVSNRHECITNWEFPHWHLYFHSILLFENEHVQSSLSNCEGWQEHTWRSGDFESYALLASHAWFSMAFISVPQST